MTIFNILIVNSGALPKGRKKPEETLRDMETINYPYTGNETEHFEHSVHVELSKWHKRENVKLIESLNKALLSNCDDININIETLLFGNDDYSYDVNSKIFGKVRTFIIQSKRF